MVRVRYLDPEIGDQMLDMQPAEAVDFIWNQKEKGLVKFGVWEGQEAQLELDQINKTNLLEVLKERDEQTLRLVPMVAGG